MRHNVIIPSVPRSSKGLYPSGFLARVFYSFLVSPSALYNLTYRPPFSYHSNNILWRLPIVKFLIIQFYRASCCFVLVRYKFSSQHPVFKYRQPMTFLHVRDQVSRPNKTTSYCFVCFISFFAFLLADRKRDRLPRPHPRNSRSWVTGLYSLCLRSVRTLLSSFPRGLCSRWLHFSDFCPLDGAPAIPASRNSYINFIFMGVTRSDANCSVY
jgi:hypothetical protein